MTQRIQSAQSSDFKLEGGAAIIAPVSAFSGSIPPNALVVVPVPEMNENLKENMERGPMAVTRDQMWELLGFNGPPVKVPDAQGRPVTIGLEDHLSNLRSHWEADEKDLQRARQLVSEMMKYQRFEDAEQVVSQIVARDGDGQDWMVLGIAQLKQEKFVEAESTLKSTRNLLPDNPYTHLQLAECYKRRKETDKERECIEDAIRIQPDLVDAWATLFLHLRREEGDAEALETVSKLADEAPNEKSTAPFIAIQGVLGAGEETRAQAMAWAKKALDRNGNDAMALVSYSAHLGENGQYEEMIRLLSKHEALMTKDVRLAHNYFEALMKKKDLGRATNFLKKLSGSDRPEVKRFAQENSRRLVQLMQQLQKKMSVKKR